MKQPTVKPTTKNAKKQSAKPVSAMKKRSVRLKPTAKRRSGQAKSAKITQGTWSPRRETVKQRKVRGTYEAEVLARWRKTHEAHEAFAPKKHRVKTKRSVKPKPVVKKRRVRPKFTAKALAFAAKALARQQKVDPVASKARGSFDAYLLKQTKKNHKYLVQTLKTRWRLSRSKNPKLKAKLAQLIGRPVNPSEAGTSAQAFKSIDDRRARMRTEVMKEIMNQGTHGSTTYEIEQSLDMLHQTASARVYELTGQGRIVDSGVRRKTGSGRNAIVHVQSMSGFVSLVPPPVGNVH
jgi:hypothetical protein